MGHESTDIETAEPCDTNEFVATPEVREWRSFLMDSPPGGRALVDRAAYKQQYPISVAVQVPELKLLCDGSCDGTSYCRGLVRTSGKLFGGIDSSEFQPDSSSLPVYANMPYDVVIAYQCERCSRWLKSYSLRFWSIGSGQDEVSYADVQKLAEWPPFSPRTPGKVVSLIGPERELFLKGRRAEVEGLGIGAFSYYRRVVEDQKNRLIDEIVRVSRHLGVDSAIVAQLELAKRENQFSKAVDSVKDAIPRALYIKGHNPLSLLHSALSKGLHEADDATCLTAANDIRLLLGELAERLADATKDQRQLDEAVNRLSRGL